MKEFGIKKVLEEPINEVKLHAYYIGYDLGKYRLDDFAGILLDGLVDFAFGYHTGILDKYDRRDLIEAARSLYKINGFLDAKCVYLDNDGMLPVDAPEEVKESFNKYEKSIVRRGEFGELLLHVVLRDCFGTVPLLSKIYFKDSDGVTVHGFDAIHIGPDISSPQNDSLYLGESKLYHTPHLKAGEAGVKALAQDICDHFSVDFLKREFAIVAKRKTSYVDVDNYPDANSVKEYEAYLKKKDEWISSLHLASIGHGKLQDVLSSVTVPMICTYESAIFKSFADDSVAGFAGAFEKEIRDLHKIFQDEIAGLPVVLGEPNKQALNIVLLLLPIPSKKDLVKLLHKKVWAQYNA